MKKILLACGSGVCTSTAAANKLKTELEKRGKGGMFTITQCKVAECVVKSADYDLLVATTTVPNTCLLYTSMRVLAARRASWSQLL